MAERSKTGLGLSLCALLLVGPGCDARPTLKIALYDVPAMVDRLELSVWLRYPDPTAARGPERRLITEELLRPDLRDQTLIPRTQLINSGSTSLGLALNGELHPSADTQVIVSVVARRGTRLAGLGSGQSLLTSADPPIPDILDISLTDPLRLGAKEADLVNPFGVTSARLACNLASPGEAPVLTVLGWGITPMVRAQFREGTGGSSAVLDTEVAADSGQQLQVRFDQAFAMFQQPQLALTLKGREGSTGLLFNVQPIMKCPTPPE
jgi:hypothetical protein